MSVRGPREAWRVSRSHSAVWAQLSERRPPSSTHSFCSCLIDSSQSYRQVIYRQEIPFATVMFPFVTSISPAPAPTLPSLLAFKKGMHYQWLRHSLVQFNHSPDMEPLSTALRGRREPWRVAGDFALRPEPRFNFHRLVESCLRDQPSKNEECMQSAVVTSSAWPLRSPR